MSAIAGILVGVAAEVGAPIIKRILENRFGKVSGELAETVIKTVAEKAGVEPIELEKLKPTEVKDAVLAAEAEMPELMPKGLYARSLIIIVAPIVNQRLGTGGGVMIEMVDLATLMTLTSWFMALYMGGHTVKDLGKNVIDAVLKRGKS